LLVMGDQRVLRPISDFGATRNFGYFAALVGSLFQMLHVVQPDAIKGARHKRQFDLHIAQQMRARRAMPLAKGIAIDRYHAVAFDKAPRCRSIGGEFEPAHASSSRSAALKRVDAAGHLSSAAVSVAAPSPMTKRTASSSLAPSQ